MTFTEASDISLLLTMMMMMTVMMMMMMTMTVFMVTEDWLPGLQGEGRVDCEGRGDRGDGPPGAVGRPGEDQGQGHDRWA